MFGGIGARYSPLQQVWLHLQCTIAKLYPAVAGKLQVRQKCRSNDNNGIKCWWFLLRGEEEHLSDLEQGWDYVLFQTQWKLEKCFKVVEPTSQSEEISESQQISSPTVVASASISSAPTATPSNTSTSDVSPFCRRICNGQSSHAEC